MIGKGSFFSPGIFFLSLAVLLTSGCAAIQQEKQDSFDQLYTAGRYHQAANLELKEKGDKKADPSCLLPSLQAAATLRFAGDYQQSSSLFDECEKIIKQHNEELLAKKATSNIGAVLVNDTLLDYQATEYDGIMVNTYKALNFWQTGKKDLARVEFNRALDRQKRAKERFAAEIALMKEQLKKQQQQENSKATAAKKNTGRIDIDRNVNNPAIEKILRKKYSNLYEFQAYPDFINPFTTYVAGLFFMSEGDYPRAVSLLKETYGMVDKNKIVLGDFAHAEKMFDGEGRVSMRRKINRHPRRKHKGKSRWAGNDHRNYTWVIFENGLGPEKEDLLIDFPLFIPPNKVTPTRIALPKLKLRNQAYPYLELVSEGHQIGRTSLLASMDRVVETEFRKDYPPIVTRAIISTLIKTFARHLARKEFGDLGDLAATIFQYASTAADTRIWSTLPKEFQVAKIPVPLSGLLSIETPTGVITRVSIPTDGNSIVYVKIPTSTARMTYNVIKM